VLLIGVGGLAKQSEDAVDLLRKQGYKAGVVRVRTYRPFPVEDLLQYTRKVPYIGVVDRSTAFGSPTGGPLSTDIMAICHRDPASKDTHILPFIAGLGGRDVTIEEQVEQFKALYEFKEKGKEPLRKERLFGTYWTGIVTQRKSCPEDMGNTEYWGDI
jgi:pyruvate/2-oxoacid:ferredoxin oxidoreductase alpha subunit